MLKIQKRLLGWNASLSTSANPLPYMSSAIISQSGDHHFIDLQRHGIFHKASRAMASRLLQIALCSCIALGSLSTQAEAFSPLPCRSTTTQTLLRESSDNANNKEGPLDFIFNPIESKIPKEIEQEIYQAEANTQAAKDRSKRVTIYTMIAVIGVTGAFYNGFLTELRSSSGPDEIPFVIEESSFAWVLGSWLTKFLFMNKIGGALLLVFGAGSGMLAEAEMDTRRTNAEKIWEEMQRRRSAPESRKQKKTAAPSRKKSGKKSKRLDALAEVIATDDTPVNEELSLQTVETPASVETEKKNEGILGAVKDFYQKADSLAASQALLLNKELEDRGVIEKITDETGLKVIGKEDANKLQMEKERNE